MLHPKVAPQEALRQQMASGMAKMQFRWSSCLYLLPCFTHVGPYGRGGERNRRPALSVGYLLHPREVMCLKEIDAKSS
jgi:hypothetical protein